MKPREKGWLKEYLEFRKGLLKNVPVDRVRKASHPEHSLYGIIQPTGLMYGQSVEDFNLPDSEQWDEKDRMKVLLAESLIGSSLLFYDKPIKVPRRSPELFSRHWKASVTSTITYFRSCLRLQKQYWEERSQLLSLRKKFWTSE
jgi:hypothetical protein